MNYKSKTVPVKISRDELCDMLIATTAIAQAFKAEGLLQKMGNPSRQVKGAARRL